MNYSFVIDLKFHCDFNLPPPPTKTKPKITTNKPPVSVLNPPPLFTAIMQNAVPFVLNDRLVDCSLSSFSSISLFPLPHKFHRKPSHPPSPSCSPHILTFLQSTHPTTHPTPSSASPVHLSIAIPPPVGERRVSAPPVNGTGVLGATVVLLLFA